SWSSRVWVQLCQSVCPVHRSRRRRLFSYWRFRKWNSPAGGRRPGRKLRMAILLDALEAEAIVFFAQPASERHPFAAECDDAGSNANLPAHLLAKPGCYCGAAVLFPHIEHAAQANGAVFIQAFHLSLAEALVMGVSFLGGDVQLPEGRLEHSVAW